MQIMDKIYILKKQKIIHGPYSLERVKERGLKYTDMVWYEGLEDWTPVDQVKIFEGYIKKTKIIRQSLFDKVFSFLK